MGIYQIAKIHKTHTIAINQKQTDTYEILDVQMHISIQIMEHMTFIKQYREIFTYKHLRSKYYTVPLTFHIGINQLQSMSILCTD